jgi:hypothetical protein
MSQGERGLLVGLGTRQSFSGAYLKDQSRTRRPATYQRTVYCPTAPAEIGR